MSILQLPSIDTSFVSTEQIHPSKDEIHLAKSTFTESSEELLSTFIKYIGSQLPKNLSSKDILLRYKKLLESEKANANEIIALRPKLYDVLKEYNISLGSESMEALMYISDSASAYIINKLNKADPKTVREKAKILLNQLNEILSIPVDLSKHQLPSLNVTLEERAEVSEPTLNKDSSASIAPNKNHKKVSARKETTPKTLQHNNGHKENDNNIPHEPEVIVRMKLVEANQKINRLQSQRDEELNELNSKLKDFQSEIIELQCENNRLNKENFKLSLQIRTSLLEKKLEINEYERKLNKAEAENKNLSDELNKLRVDLKQTQTQDDLKITKNTDLNSISKKPRRNAANDKVPIYAPTKKVIMDSAFDIVIQKDDLSVFFLAGKIEGFKGPRFSGYSPESIEAKQIVDKIIGKEISNFEDLLLKSSLYFNCFDHLINSSTKQDLYEHILKQSKKHPKFFSTTVHKLYSIERERNSVARFCKTAPAPELALKIWDIIDYKDLSKVKVKDDSQFNAYNLENYLD